MKRLILMLMLVLPFTVVGQNKFKRVNERIPNSYIVVLKPNMNPRTFSNGMNAKRVYTHIFKGFSANMSEQAAIALSNNPNVEYVQEDVVVHMAGGVQANPPSYGLDRVDQRTPFLDQQYIYNYTGRGVRIYNMDSGINTSHVDFTGRIEAGVSVVDGVTSIEDCHGHGTHTSGIMLGSSYGVAKEATLVPVRIFGCSLFAEGGALLGGLDWVAENAIHPAVLSLQVEVSSIFPAMDDALTTVMDSGITVVAAAGNSNDDACLHTPAHNARILVVGASDTFNSVDSRAGFSNWGQCLDMFAPGVFIQSDWIGSSTATATQNGTSMAGPHATGAAALYLQARPDDTPDQTHDFLVMQSTPNTITGNLFGSPNKMLYTNWVVESSLPCSGTPYPGYARVGQPEYYPGVNGFTLNALSTISATIDSRVGVTVTLQRLVSGTWTNVTPMGSSTTFVRKTVNAGTYRWVVTTNTTGSYTLCTQN